LLLMLCAASAMAAPRCAIGSLLRQLGYSRQFLILDPAVLLLVCAYTYNKLPGILADIITIILTSTANVALDRGL